MTMTSSTKTRIETDSFGKLKVPSDKYYGAQTARSLINFPIGIETMPPSMIRALGIIKRSAALANKKAKNLDAKTCKAIVSAASEVAEASWTITSRYQSGKQGQARSLI